MIKTLFEAIVLVVLVVYLFLQSLRTTLICSVAIVVALVATFAGMLALGFSINLLTLFGLVLAIGMVVDDAIVVVENVERNMAQHHLDPKAATIRSMDEIASSLVAVVLVMSSVFIPAAFLPGTTGQLYKQFAITIVISVSVSGFIALTLTPAMCAALLKHNPPPTRGFFAWFNRQVDRVTRAFGHAVTWVIARMAIALVLLAGFLYAIWHLFHILPTSFVPNEDQGYAMAAIIMPEAASLDRTQAVAEQVDAIFKGIPGVATRTMITGYSLIDSGFKTNAGTFFVTFTDFDERYASIDKAKTENARAILVNFFQKAQKIEGAVVIPIAPPPIPGISPTGGFEFWIQDTGSGDPTQLDDVVQAFLAKARARPELTGLASTYRANSQQLRADVDREKTTLLGIPIQDVYSAIQAQFGSLPASQFNQCSHVWWVIVQSDAQFRRNPEDLTRLYTRNSQNQMVPLSSVVTTRWTAGPGHPAALQRLPGREDHRQQRAGQQLRRSDHRHGGDREGRAAAGLHVRVVRPRVRGEEIGRHVVDRVRVRPHHRVPRARRAVRVLDAAGRSDDRRAVRHPRRSRHQLGARPHQRRLLPDRPAGADRPWREERGAARVGGRRVPQGRQVDHGSDDPRRRAAAAADHHDVARVRDGLSAVGTRDRRGGERAPFDRHRHHRRHDRRDDARDAVRAAVLLPLRPAEGAQRKAGGGTRRLQAVRRRRPRHRQPRRTDDARASPSASPAAPCSQAA